MLAIKAFHDNKAYKLFAIGFILINVTSFATMFINLQCGLIFSLYALCYMLSVHNLSILEKSYTYQLFNLFVFLELLSIPLSFLSPYGEFLVSNPMVFLYGFSYLLIPQLFFYKVGVAVKDTKQSLLLLLRCNAVLVLVSIALYIVRPGFYLNLISTKFPETFDIYGGFVPRLVGYIADSMAMGVICSSSFVLSLAYVEKKKFIYLLIFLAGSIMSMQRGSWITLIVASLIYLILTKKVFKLSFKWIILIGLLVVSMIYFITTIELEGSLSYMDLLMRRFDNIGSAGGERNMQWFGVIDAVSNYPLGFGLGSLSHKGVGMGFPVVCPDGNYFRILGDTGVLGFLIFLFLNCSTLWFLFNHRRYALMCALLVFLAQAVGTNVFDLYYASFIYWFLLGTSSKMISNGK